MYDFEGLLAEQTREPKFWSEWKTLQSELKIRPVLLFSARTSSINFLGKTKKIKRYGFGNYKNLTSVVIPASMKKIGFDAFEGCKKLTIYVPTRAAMRCQNIVLDDKIPTSIINTKILYRMILILNSKRRIPSPSGSPRCCGPCAVLWWPPRRRYT